MHGEDIRRPLGLRRDYPTGQVVRTLTSHTRTGAFLGGGKARVAGLTLRADDADFTHGSGPLLHGPAISLLLAACGRRVAVDDLDGPGVKLIAQRI